jgi:O-antigen/teichoic acid export membrane protein
LFNIKITDFARNVLTLMTGSTIAQAILMASTPILTRIYTPDDFGLVAIYVSLASVLSIVATGRYEMAIILAEKQQESDDLTLISIFIATGVAFLSLIIVVVFDRQIINLVANEDIAMWLYFIPISVLAAGLYQSFNYWLNRKKLYRDLSQGRVISSVTNVSTAAAIGFSRVLTNGMVVGSILSNVITATFYGRKVLSHGFHPNVDKNKVSRYLKKYYKLPLFQLPNALVDGVRQSVVNIFIGRFFGIEILGFYSLALKMLMLPSALVGGAISQVFYQKLSGMHNNGEITFSFVCRFVLKLLLLSLPFYLLLYYFAIDLFEIFFGKNWAVSGEVVKELMPWFYLMLVSSSISTVYIVFGKQAYLFGLSLVYLFVPIVSIIYNASNIFDALIWMNIGMSSVLIVMIILALKFSYNESENIKLKVFDEIK